MKDQERGCSSADWGHEVCLAVSPYIERQANDNRFAPRFQLPNTWISKVILWEIWKDEFRF